MKINFSWGQKRESNLELFRIVAMLLIVAHHYVVNSGLLAGDGPVYSDVFSKRSTFLLIFGAWGKTGINCFLLITGYFMCKAEISVEKYLKLYGEIIFYRLIIGFIFIIAGYETFSVMWLVKLLMPFNKLESNFTGCFMAFYLCIPFLNVLIRNITEIQHIYLTTLLLIMYTGISTLSAISGFSVDMNYVTWFAVLYLIAAYIRLYPKPFLERTKLWGLIASGCFILSIFSIIVCRWLNYKFEYKLPLYYFVSDSNKILAVLTAVSAFLFFKNLNIKYTPWINAFGASTFGVLMIHANSDAMRQWLWKDVLDNVGAYSLGLGLLLHAIGSVLGVFIICSLLDMLRIRLVEVRFLKWIDKKLPLWKLHYIKIEEWFAKKLQISIADNRE